MNVIYKWIDYITHILPPVVISGIRLGALGLWLIIAIYIVIGAWRRGTESAAQQANNAGLGDRIDEKLKRNQNLREAPDIILPDLSPNLVDEDLSQNDVYNQDREIDEQAATTTGNGQLDSDGQPRASSKPKQTYPAYYANESLEVSSPTTKQQPYLPQSRQRRVGKNTDLPLLPVDEGLELEQADKQQQTDKRQQVSPQQISPQQARPEYQKNESDRLLPIPRKEKAQ